MRILVLALVSFFTLAAVAQEMPLPPGHASEAQVRQLFKVMHVEAMQHQVMQGVVQQLPKLANDTLAAQIPNATAKDAEFTSTVVQDELKKFADPKITQQMLDAMVPVYMRNISSADIQNMIAFYGSPTGQRVLEAMPIMSQQAMAKMMPVLQAQMKQLIDDQTARIEAYAAQQKKSAPVKSKS